MLCENSRLDQWLQQNLACPRDFKPLQIRSDTLICPEKHVYPIVQGVPVFLLKEVVPTQKRFWENLGQPHALDEPTLPNGLDPFVQQAISATSGNLYRSLRLRRYPIPEFPLDRGEGGYLLDLGCNWGRWCISAARKGYIPIGVDPNMDAILAAKRVSKQLNTAAYFLVADARHLPFRSHSIDTAFSYSVLQHFDKNDVHHVLQEISRILNPGGLSLIEMPNALGPHNLLHQLKRGFRRARDFEVRCWTPSELRKAFGLSIGPTSLSADGYFSLNPQAADLDLLPFRFRLVVKISEFLRRGSLLFPWMICAADSLYVKSEVRQFPSSNTMLETPRGPC